MVPGSWGVQMSQSGPTALDTSFSALHASIHLFPSSPSQTKRMNLTHSCIPAWPTLPAALLSLKARISDGTHHPPVLCPAGRSAVYFPSAPPPFLAPKVAAPRSPRLRAAPGQAAVPELRGRCEGAGRSEGRCGLWGPGWAGLFLSRPRSLRARSRAQSP